MPSHCMCPSPAPIGGLMMAYLPLLIGAPPPPLTVSTSTYSCISNPLGGGPRRKGVGETTQNKPPVVRLARRGCLPTHHFHWTWRTHTINGKGWHPGTPKVGGLALRVWQEAVYRAALVCTLTCKPHGCQEHTRHQSTKGEGGASGSSSSLGGHLLGQ